MSTAKNYNVIFSSGQRTLYRWRVCVCGFSIRHISFEGSTNWIYVWHRVVIDSICWAWNRCQNSRRHKKKVCIFGIELSEANELCVWHMCHALFPVLTTHFPVHIVPKNNVSPVWACHKLESNFYFPGIARLSHRRTDEFGWFEFYLYISCVQLLAAHRTRRRKRWNEYTTRQHICNGDYIDEWQNSNKCSERRRRSTWKSVLRWKLNANVLCAYNVECECEYLLLISFRSFRRRLASGIILLQFICFILCAQCRALDEMYRLTITARRICCLAVCICGERRGRKGWGRKVGRESNQKKNNQKKKVKSLMRNKNDRNPM